MAMGTSADKVEPPKQLGIAVHSGLHRAGPEFDLPQVVDIAAAQLGVKETCDGCLASIARRAMSSRKCLEASHLLRASWEKRAVAQKHVGR